MPGDPPSPRRPLARIIVFSVLGIALFAGVMAWGGRGAIERLLLVQPLDSLGYVAVIFVLTYLSAVRWGMLTNLIAGRRLCGYGTYYTYFMLSRVAGELLLPPSASDFILRPALVKLRGDASVLQAAGGVFSDRAIDIMLFAVGMGPALLYSLGRISISAFWGLLLGLIGLWAVVFAGFSQHVGAWLKRLLVGTGERMLGLGWGLAQRAGQMSLRAGNELGLMADSPSDLRTVSLLSAARFLLIGWQFYIIARSTQVDLSFTEIMAGMPLAQIASALAATPGSLGFREGGFWGAFAMMGVPEESGRVFVAAQRVILTATLMLLMAMAVTVHGIIHGGRRLGRLLQKRVLAWTANPDTACSPPPDGSNE